MQSSSRRQVLAAGTALAGTAALTACGSGPDYSSANRSANDGNSGSGSSPTPDESSSSSTGSSTGSSSGGGSGHTLVALDKVPVGGAVAAKDANGKPIVVARPTSTTAAAFSAICTHQGCTVAPSGKQLLCPCHGSVFTASTGKNVSGPAPSPLPSVAVKVVNGNVVQA